MFHINNKIKLKMTYLPIVKLSQNLLNEEKLS